MDLSLIDLPTEVVRTGRLVLRPYRADDVDPVYRACQDAGIQRWIGTIPVPYTEAHALEFIETTAAERAEHRALIVAVEADGELVGSAGLHLRQGLLGPAVGYWIAPWARGHGYAAETARGLADWGLGLGAPRVHLMADVDNIPSQAAARRAGFTHEGVVRSCLEYRDGSRGDAALFSRLPDD
ncbi:GNAT family N-acetyltransferase [Candidatus Blastococcus massiliensis]|uniref:GNAT family N-acetyltransferase n=1 Tax=Candidatus Blastococcus massiliensis TaxID=1470358 RepID=UPI0004BA9B2D|nr:GNAT family N-acetyltransferase [Candidatus Blastococcus massiliensis]